MPVREQLTLENWEQKAHRLAHELREIRESQGNGETFSMQRARAYRRKKYELDLHIAAVDDDG
jgi:hypothetical protein